MFDWDNPQIALTTINGFDVSTIRLTNGFETMVWVEGTGQVASTGLTRNYTNRRDALKGHSEVVDSLA